MVREKWVYNFQDWFLPFLYNGFNLATLQSLGENLEEIELLHTSAIGSARIFAPSFKDSPEILSVPATFEMLIHCKISETFFKLNFL